MKKHVSSKKPQIHILGIVGVPGNYGGFETLVDNLLDSEEFLKVSTRVYCEKEIALSQGLRYKGAQLVPISWRANGWQSVIHDSIALWSASMRGGSVLVLGTSATFWLPILRILFPNVRYIVNMAGMEWARTKWGAAARCFIKNGEATAARYSHVFIADNQGLVDYVVEEYSRRPKLIAYGGDQLITVDPDYDVINEHSLPETYDFAMARAQPDNNLRLILETYVRIGLPLVFVSNWNGNEYGRNLRERFCGHPNLYLIGPIYDARRVKALRSRVRLYIHAHSAGGTNPVLVESMWAGLPILALDVNFHRFTTRNRAFYFQTSEDLEQMVTSISEEKLHDCGMEMIRIAKEFYSWRSVRSAYEQVVLKD